MLRVLACVPFVICMIGLTLCCSSSRVLHISEDKQTASFLAYGDFVLIRGDCKKYRSWHRGELHRRICQKMPKEYHAQVLLSVPLLEPKHILQIFLRKSGIQSWFGLFSEDFLGPPKAPLISIHALHLDVLTALLAIPVLIFGVQFVLDKKRRARWKQIPACMSCGYNLTGMVNHKCPECGTPIPPEARVRLADAEATQQNAPFRYNAAQSSIDGGGKQ